MKLVTPRRVGRIVERIRGTWSELEYAQRRMLEIQTGVPFDEPKRRRIARRVEELEALYAHDDPRFAN